jgi:hypothetical protein
LNLTHNGYYIALKDFYNDVENRLIDRDYFHCLLGKDLLLNNPTVEEYIESE